MASPIAQQAPDGGWGWMVVLAAFIQTALVFGVIRSSGIFFVEFVAHFQASSSAVSWIVSLGITVLQFGSPVASALSAQHGTRVVVMVGGFLAGLGLLLASFSTSLTHLYLSIGLVTGLGWALVFTPSIAAVSHYFEKRRTLAVGLAVSGAGISSLAFSPLFQYLVDLYGWRGALRTVAGMSLNLVVSGALLRPLATEGDRGRAKEGKGTGWLGSLASLFALELLRAHLSLPPGSGRLLRVLRRWLRPTPVHQPGGDCGHRLCAWSHRTDEHVGKCWSFAWDPTVRLGEGPDRELHPLLHHRWSVPRGWQLGPCHRAKLHLPCQALCSPDGELSITTARTPCS